MAFPRFGCASSMLLIFGLILVLMPGKAAAFGAGNIPSIAQVEGHNWRHGDIEDMLKTIAFLHGKKWTTLLVQRTYFGNWLRDYSQAVDVASLKGVNAATIRVLVWVLSFLANGYATEEFEVTDDRLGVYRPEEHIDNPLGYAEGVDAQKFDPRLRGPVRPVETEIDSQTGMKNYIANERGDWATSAGYLRYSFARSIHFGRLYTSGSSGKGKEEDLCEALRCLGQALHCMEDFPAHSNYCELALRELGYHDVFAHCGTNAEINLRGRRVFPIVTGTFGGVDFLHSVLGEANDHFTQSEVDQLDIALKNSEKGNQSQSQSRSGDFERSSGSSDFISLVAKLPGIGGGMASEATNLKRMADEKERENERMSGYSGTRSNANIVPGMSENFDPVKVSKQIYPILEFRDKIVKSINRGIAKVPGLENLLEHISETLTAFVLGLLAPFIRPIINAVTKVLKDGSSGVISASAHSQLEPWKNPNCTDPTHSMLSKDHFTNVLNSCAGRVAATILQYAVPRVLYAWEHTGVPVDEVVNDVLRALHHPAIRDEHVEIQRDMFNTVRKWADEYPRRHELNHILGSQSVRTGKNHTQQSSQKGHSHGGGIFDGGLMEQLGHGRPKGSLWSQCATRDLSAMGAGPGSNYSSRPSSSSGKPLGSPGYGYGQQNPPQSGDGHLAPYPGYGGPPSNHHQGGYAGGPPPSHGEAAGYYHSSSPQSQPPQQHHQPHPHHQPHGGYPGQGYGGPPPPHQPYQGGYPPYPQQHEYNQPQPQYGQQQQPWGGYGGPHHPPYP
ncbi:heterokaryon incompatibility Het-C [Xylariomycetidae sp. FL2044]|nr:heterokaryon incompatibility Het-C [Xylariomycetidae sp. FL2044]